MSLTPEQQLKMSEWRAKARDGTLTMEEQREVISALRAARGQITPASAGSTKRKAAAAAKAKPNGDDLLKELEGI